MTGNRSKGKPITNLDEKRRAGTQRILDSMPAVIDEIKEEREREAWKRRKAVREREKSRTACDSPVVETLRPVSKPSAG
jgi:hypothetical protein